MDTINSKLLNWASILEDNTRAQAELSSTMPFIFPHIALMPDAHLGKGATVGSVIPTLDAIMPAAVGVDIGCGMMAVKTQWDVSEVMNAKHGGSSTARPLSHLRREIERAVPLSAGHYNQKIVKTAEQKIEVLTQEAQVADFEPGDYAKNWELQLGTLGSGNHFIEITVDEEGAVWAFLHSGSRGVGNKIATSHIRVAQDQMKERHIQLPDKDLAYLVPADQEFWNYINEMQWAQTFALLNREEMMIRVLRQLSEHMGEPVTPQETINCHHNYTQREQHFGKTVWLSRKGAINASEGTRGLIPGSMGAASYVVTGKGNVQSLRSSPHGAGRNYSRKKARETFTQESLEKSMVGIEWSGRDVFLDEHPQAYKDIDVVMRDAEPLVTVDHTLRQILNVKGD